MKVIALRVQRPQRGRHRGEAHDDRECDRDTPEPEGGTPCSGGWCGVAGSHFATQYRRMTDRVQRKRMLTVIAFDDNLLGVELRQLTTFVAVAEAGSFTRAADRLHVVQSAVSAGVRNLEKELGAELFDRSTHSVKLTDSGRALLPEARATLAAAQAARDAVDEVRGGVRGTVSLGTMQAQGMHAIDLAAILATFRAEHPAVEVDVRHSGGSIEMAREVRDGRLDLAFVALPGDAPAGVELTRLATEPVRLAVPAGHALARSTDVALAALGKEVL